MKVRGAEEREGREISRLRYSAKVSPLPDGDIAFLMMGEETEASNGIQELL